MIIKRAAFQEIPMRTSRGVRGRLPVRDKRACFPTQKERRPGFITLRDLVPQVKRLDFLPSSFICQQVLPGRPPPVVNGMRDGAQQVYAEYDYLAFMNGWTPMMIQMTPEESAKVPRQFHPLSKIATRRKIMPAVRLNSAAFNPVEFSLLTQAFLRVI
jgi:hypothetical protein